MNVGVTINMLPNDVLLEIFDWYLGEDQDDLEVDAWYPLVHVCRSWRNIIFRSPHRLNLRLFYTAKPGKPANEMLGVWPAFPIIVQVNDERPWSVQNVIAALEHRDRIRKIQLLSIEDMELEPISIVMEEPFPALTDLVLTSLMWTDCVPDPFLGGLAPRLRSLKLGSISCPGLSNLVLSSARDLVELSLLDLPPYGYIAPEKMVTILSALTRLETLSLEFDINDDDLSTDSLQRSRIRNPTLPPCSVLPSLKFCLFQGIYGYLEDFLAIIDTPRLEILDITLCNIYSLKGKRNQFKPFLGRTEMFKTLNNASIHLLSDKVEITLSRKPWACDAKVTFKIMCQDKIYNLGRVCLYQILPLSDIESLGISSQYHKWQSHLKASEDSEDAQWPLSLCKFSAVKTLYLSKEVVPSIACGLKDAMYWEGRTPMLGSLQKISISTATVKPLPSGSVKTAIEQFAAMRGLSAQDPPTNPFCWVANERNASDL
jgi:hypothetical protein